MLRELLSIFKASDDPLHEMGQNFSRMLQLTDDMSIAAGQIFFRRRAGRCSTETDLRLGCAGQRT